MQPVGKSKAVTFKFRAKEEIQAAIYRDIELKALAVVYNPSLEPNARNFTDEQLVDFIKLIIDAKKEKNKPLDLDSLGEEATYLDLAVYIHQKFKKPEDYELTDDSKEVAKILIPYEEIVPRSRKQDSNLTEDDINGANEAYNFIRDVYIHHAKTAYDEVSKYLAKEFFNNDEILILAGTPVEGKAKSYNELCRLMLTMDEGGPSRTWLFNALHLLQDGLRLKKIADKEIEAVHTYERLPVSHKIALWDVKDIDEKVRFINKIAEGRKNEYGNAILGNDGKPIPLSVRDTKKLIKPPKEIIKTYSEVLINLTNNIYRCLSELRNLPKNEKENVDHEDIEKKLLDLIDEISKYC